MQTEGCHKSASACQPGGGSPTGPASLWTATSRASVTTARGRSAWTELPVPAPALLPSPGHLNSFQMCQGVATWNLPGNPAPPAARTKLCRQRATVNSALSSLLPGPRNLTECCVRGGCACFSICSDSVVQIPHATLAAHEQMAELPTLQAPGMPRLFGADGCARPLDGDRPGLPEHQHLQLVCCWWQSEHFIFLEFFGCACPWAG